MAGGTLMGELSDFVVTQIRPAMRVTGTDQLSYEVVLVAGTPIVRVGLFTGDIVFVSGIVTTVTGNELTDQVTLIANVTLLTTRQLQVVYLADEVAQGVVLIAALVAATV